MSESHQAQLLAQWLESGPGTSPPDDLDREVVEGLYALRPDLAPALRVTVDDVLAAVTDGPFLDPTVADALRAWLEGPAGTAPPDTLPQDIIEAAYALHPDRAPAHRVTIEDVLDAVQTGPLKTDDVVDLSAVRSAARGWVWPGIGVIAVAATALLFVGPIAHKAEQTPQETLDLLKAPAEKKARSAPIEARNAVPDPQAEASMKQGNEVDEAPAIPPPTARSMAVAPSSAGEAEPTTAEPATIAEAAPPPSPPSTRSPVQPRPARAKKSQKQTRAMGEASGDMVGQGRRGEYGSGGRASFGTRRPAGAPAAPPPVAAMDDVEDAPVDMAEETTTDDGLDTRTVIDFESVEIEPHSPEPDAVPPVTYATRSDSPLPTRLDSESVRLQNAIRQAQEKLAAGDAAEALRIIEMALFVEGGLPPLRARLYRLKADAHTALGQPDEAARARQSAATLDPAR